MSNVARVGRVAPEASPCGYQYKCQYSEATSDQDTKKQG